MFDAILSDDGNSVLVFFEDTEEPETLEANDFATVYGEEALIELREKQQSKKLQTMEVSRPLQTTQSSQEDVDHYWKAFRRLLELCGQYTGKAKLLQNADEGVLKAQCVVFDYYKTERKLAQAIMATYPLLHAAVHNLDYWSRKVGYKRMSTPDDVKKYNLNRRADTVVLLEHLLKPDFRKRTYRRVDKYAKKKELKSPAEVVTEVLMSYKTRQPS